MQALEQLFKHRQDPALRQKMENTDGTLATYLQFIYSLSLLNDRFRQGCLHRLKKKQEKGRRKEKDLQGVCVQHFAIVCGDIAGRKFLVPSKKQTLYRDLFSKLLTSLL